MAMSESATSDAAFAVLDAAQDYGAAGAPQLASARAQLRVIANAIAKCIPHLVANGAVSTTDTGAVAGAVTVPAPTAGAVTATGTGTIGGLVQGSAGAATGLAGAILGVLEAGFSGPDRLQARPGLAALADAFASFAPYVMSHAVVHTVVTGIATTLGANGPTTGTGTGSLS